MTYRVYILASKKDGVVYVGVTNNILRRVCEHKSGVNEKSFTNKYFVKKLVYCEPYKSITDAIQREKQIKKRNRKKKINLIEMQNPERNNIGV